MYYYPEDWVIPDNNPSLLHRKYTQTYRLASTVTPPSLIRAIRKDKAGMWQCLLSAAIVVFNSFLDSAKRRYGSLAIVPDDLIGEYKFLPLDVMFHRDDMVFVSRATLIFFE